MRAVLLALAIALAAIVGAPAQAAPQAVAEQVSAPSATIEVRGVESVRVAKTSRPGELRVTNPNSRRVRFIWGTFDRARPDGSRRIGPYRTVTIEVHRHVIDWIALLGGDQIAQGTVREIDL